MIGLSKKSRKIPLRTCVGCRNVQGKNDMLRVVRTPDNSVVIDTKGKQPGRGAYICYSTDCLKRAFKRKVLDKALVTEVNAKIYDGLKEEIISLQRQSSKR